VVSEKAAACALLAALVVIGLSAMASRVANKTWTSLALARGEIAFVSRVVDILHCFLVN